MVSLVTSRYSRGDRGVLRVFRRPRPASPPRSATASPGEQVKKSNFKSSRESKDNEIKSFVTFIFNTRKIDVHRLSIGNRNGIFHDKEYNSKSPNNDIIYHYPVNFETEGKPLLQLHI